MVVPPGVVAMSRASPARTPPSIIASITMAT
jgi:hypothetical protein